MDRDSVVLPGTRHLLRPDGAATLLAALFGLMLGHSTAAHSASDAAAIAGCPSTPNCVSSRSHDEGHHVRPLSFEGSREDAWQRLRRALRDEPRLRVVEDRPAEGYLRAEATSRMFGFVDDVELKLVPEANIIDVRSASRVGYWDLGVNRRRVERLRVRYRQSSDQP